MIEPGRVAVPAPTAPVSLSGLGGTETTTMVLLPRADGLPDVGWMGLSLAATDVRSLTIPAPVETTAWNSWLIGSPVSVLPEHARGYLDGLRCSVTGSAPKARGATGPPRSVPAQCGVTTARSWSRPPTRQRASNCASRPKLSREEASASGTC